MAFLEQDRNSFYEMKDIDKVIKDLSNYPSLTRFLVYVVNTTSPEVLTEIRERLHCKKTLYQNGFLASFAAWIAENLVGNTVAPVTVFSNVDNSSFSSDLELQASLAKRSSIAYDCKVTHFIFSLLRETSIPKVEDSLSFSKDKSLDKFKIHKDVLLEALNLTRILIDNEEIYVDESDFF